MFIGRTMHFNHDSRLLFIWINLPNYGAAKRVWSFRCTLCVCSAMQYLSTCVNSEFKHESKIFLVYGLGICLVVIWEAEAKNSQAAFNWFAENDFRKWWTAGDDGNVILNQISEVVLKFNRELCWNYVFNCNARGDKKICIHVSRLSKYESWRTNGRIYDVIMGNSWRWL